jgi:uncharacterized lipoprotein YddW (UPF0748 family)
MNFTVYGIPKNDFAAKDMDYTFKNMAQAGINQYNAFISLRGKSWFNSKYVKNTDGDLLGRIMESASKYNINVYPIIGLGHIVGTPVKGTLTYGQYVYKEEALENWVCPSSKTNRELIVEILLELIENYSIKGVRLDYFRYPNSSTTANWACNCKSCVELRLAKWKEDYSKHELQDRGTIYREVNMRNEVIDNFLKEISNVTRQKSVKLTASVRARFIEDAIIEGQNWIEWAEKGLVDVVSPISYRTDTKSFEKLVNKHSYYLKDSKADYYAGVAKKSSVGEISTNDLLLQIKITSEAGAKGCSLFHLNVLTEQDFYELSWLKI